MSEKVKKKLAKIMSIAVPTACLVSTVVGGIKLCVKIPGAFEKINQTDLSDKSFWEKFKFAVSLW